VDAQLDEKFTEVTRIGSLIYESQFETRLMQFLVM
jgi:hypothetical protein